MSQVHASVPAAAVVDGEDGGECELQRWEERKLEAPFCAAKCPKDSSSTHNKDGGAHELFMVCVFFC